ncbi:MAG: alpha/beta hydrolase [Acidimicrobiales bacterium]|nr:alpha/beta hydrolase [Acidimicrobiales bacterium]
MRCHLPRTLAALLAALLFAVACSSDQVASTAESTSAPTATAAPRTTAPTTTAPAPATTSSTTTTIEEPAPPAQLVDSTATIEDETLGPLTFDVRSAGDPARAAEGKTVMLLHGFPETNRSWDTVSTALAEAGFFAVAMNQRGYSAGARPDGVEYYAATNLIDDVFSVADALGAETFHIVGHDWGSLVAWGVAGREVLDGQGRVSSLTAMSVGHPLSFAAARAAPDGDQADRSSYVDLFQQPDSQDRFLADDAAFYRSIFAGAGYTEAELDAYLDVLGSPEAMSAALDWYRAIDLIAIESGQTIDLPTLFIWSTGDTALGREQAEGTADYVTGPYTFVEIPDVSHWVVHEATDTVIEALLLHLA